MVVVRLGRKDHCGCKDPECDDKGNVLYLQTCPACLTMALDAMRCDVYSVSASGDVSRLVQGDFFE